MASLARSFKSPPLLSPRCRPGMPGRSFSNCSEKSNSFSTAAPSQMDDMDFVLSAPGTPYLPAAEEDDASHAADQHEPGTPGLSCTHTRPIAIEVPKVQRTGSSSSPQELSARGDLAGGYFPFHEDPKTRVHRPHPFHHVPKSPRIQVPPTSSAPAPKDSQLLSAEPRTMRSATVVPASGLANTPVASFMPAGFYDSPLPMGKYYPSNWEHRHSKRAKRSPTSDSQLPPPQAKHGSSSNTPDSSHLPNDSEIQRRLQQYQRDMVAQASMATSQLLSGSSRDGAKAGLASFRGHTIHDMRLPPSVVHKPVSPRLLPLGSPGPVTPMELESSGTGYIELVASSTQALTAPRLSPLPRST